MAEENYFEIFIKGYMKSGLPIISRVINTDPISFLSKNPARWLAICQWTYFTVECACHSETDTHGFVLHSSSSCNALCAFISIQKKQHSTRFILRFHSKPDMTWITDTGNISQFPWINGFCGDYFSEMKIFWFWSLQRKLNNRSIIFNKHCNNTCKQHNWNDVSIGR